jgi:hypothetical protein
MSSNKLMMSPSLREVNMAESAITKIELKENCIPSDRPKKLGTTNHASGN